MKNNYDYGVKTFRKSEHRTFRHESVGERSVRREYSRSCEKRLLRNVMTEEYAY